MLKIIDEKYSRNVRNVSHENLEYIDPTRCNALNISLHSNDSIRISDNEKLQTTPSPRKKSRQIKTIVYTFV